MPWREFLRKVRGPGDLRVHEVVRSSHPAGDLIYRFERNGVPVVLKSAPWDQRTRDERSKRGSHKSCDDYLDFLRGEILELMEKGFWVLIPYRLLRHLPSLRLSPMGVVPQRARRPRLIVDYSFYGVNQDTLRLTPAEAMQFGRALERILYHIRHANPRFGHVYLGKVDLADGFYRLRLTDGSILKLGVAFPKYPGEEQMVALPLSIPMGWVESPPAFCAATETVADLANNMPPSMDWPEHPLEQQAWTPPEPEEDEDAGSTAPTHPTVDATIPPVLNPLRKPVRFNDIYVDDFLMGFQGSSRRQKRHLRQLLHAIDLVFRPLEPHDRPTRKHVPSVKKLLQGDAYLSTTKVVLGWLINTAAGTIELPPHRCERLRDIFVYLHKRRSVPERKWHKILDFKHLADDLISRPTAIAELVPDFPVALGPHDASGTGMGGVWLPTTSNTNICPILWRDRFPDEIVQELVSFDNPNGKINNSQLELAGQIGHQDVLTQEVNCAYRTIAPLGDNTSAVSWSHKGSVTTTGPTAYLLRLNSLHQRHFCYLSKPDYIPGVYNRMADDLSRTALDHCDAATRDAFFLDLSTADETCRASVSTKRASAQDGHWTQWQKYCHSLDIDPYLQAYTEKLPFLQVFAIRLRRGDLTPSRQPVKSRTVEDYLRTVGEEIASMGSDNPRLDMAGNVVPGIRQLQTAWSKDDPPPERVKPIPLQLIKHVISRLDLMNPFEAAKADALIIGFFYMLCPGEHTWDPDNNHPFRFCDVSFSLGDQPAANAVTISDIDLTAATRVYLNFTTQKNGEKDEAITHGDTFDALLSPVAAVRRRVQHLCHWNAPPDTPLYTVFSPSGTRNILASHLKQELCYSCSILSASLGFSPREISARALRASGAMALVRAKIDPSLVKLMGRWKSDIMLRYLQRSALHTADFATAMLSHGEFVIPRHQTLPSDAQHLVNTVHHIPLADL